MADNFNPADNLDEEARRKGGEASSSQQDMSELGKKGNQAQPTEAKRKGGERSHGGGGNNS
jgi:general stress protein YciG